MQIHRHTVLYIEPDLLVRRAIALLIAELPNFEVIAQAEGYEDALIFLEKNEPEIIIFEIALSGTSGLELLYELKRRKINSQTIVLSRLVDEEMARQCMLAGARAYLTKCIDEQELSRALEEVLLGKKYITACLHSSLMRRTIKPRILSEQDPLAPLSTREREIFHMLANGIQNSNIARQLFISPRTVETHRARVVRKLGLHTNADLIKYAIKHGLSTV